MTILKICVIAISGVILGAIIKSRTPAYGTIIQAGLVVVIVVSIIPDIKILLGALEELKQTENFSTQGLSVMLKVFSVLVVGSVLVHPKGYVLKQHRRVRTCNLGYIAVE